jgi:hypothetical protein
MYESSYGKSGEWEQIAVYPKKPTVCRLRSVRGAAFTHKDMQRAIVTGEGEPPQGTQRVPGPDYRRRRRWHALDWGLFVMP